jgi:hypothetical protein
VEVPTDPRGFDPLELPRDRQVVPEAHPQAGAISGRQVLQTPDSGTEVDSTGEAVFAIPEPVIDTFNSQAYRVQLHTSRVYGEARQAARVAEEIFDQPVYVDYEVPNYKVRVGNFPDRDQALSYQQKARAAGYSNAWVVMVNVAVRELAPLYDDLAEPLLPIPVGPVDSLDVEVEEGEGDRSED